MIFFPPAAQQLNGGVFHVRKGKRLLSGLLALLMAAVMLFCPAAAITYEPDFTLTSKAVYLENLDTGLVLYEKNADEKMYPASLTKIMTAILVLENVKDLDGETAEYPLWIQDMLYGTNASLGGLIVGERLTIRQLLTSALVQSGNESAMILAGYVGSGGMADFMPKDITTFVEMMNAKAKALGCTGTHFTNPTGLHSDNTYTTARDMSILAKYAMKNASFAAIVKNYAVELGQTNKHDDLWQYSTNKMLLTSSPYYYAPVVGIKTGSTDEAGRCVISQAEDSGYHYLCVVMGAPSTAAEPYPNFIETRQLYRWAFGNFSLRTLLEQGELMAEVPVKYSGDGKLAKLAVKEDVVRLLRDDISLDSIICNTEIPENVEAPIAAGDSIGTLHIMLMGEEIGAVDLVATQDFSLSWFRKALGTIGSLLSSTVAKVIAILVVLLIAAYIVYTVQHNKKKKKNRRNFTGRSY